MAPTTVPVAFTKTADPVGSGLVARTRRTPGFVHFLHATLPDEAIRAGPPAEPARQPKRYRRDQGAARGRLLHRHEAKVKRQKSAKARAQALLKKEVQAQLGQEAMLQYRAEQEAILIKTARLRALRLARDKERTTTGDGQTSDAREPALEAN